MSQSKLQKVLSSFSIFTTATAVFLSDFALSSVGAATWGDVYTGKIAPPPGVRNYQANSGLGDDTPAIIFFLSKMILFITVVAGLWTLFNVLMAGLHYITGGGSSESTTKVRNLLASSVIGLLLILSSYTIGGLIGYVFFGDAGYLLNPTL